MKKKTFSACVMAALLTTGVVSTQAIAGVLAEGNISVYKGGQLTNTITGQTPVAEEALMVCNEKCMIKTTGVSLVGATGTELAVKNNEEQFNVLIRKGQLDFILGGAVSKIGFYMPDGQYTVAEAVFNANTSSPVRGYVKVADNGPATIGVYEGRMVFNTAEGAKIVDSNNHILLAQAEVGAGAGSAGVGGAGASAGSGVLASTASSLGVGTTTLVVGGAALAAAAVWGVTELAKDDDDDPSPVNTSLPSNPSSNL
ncbi:MAG: hypothetical protein D3916_04075 [Candidatus Electrothrix sp. MAN1_4]|nr:hypothetical protein [Candidatus Electrothrix sp. MAN1_4]